MSGLTVPQFNGVESQLEFHSIWRKKVTVTSIAYSFCEQKQDQICTHVRFLVHCFKIRKHDYRYSLCLVRFGIQTFYWFLIRLIGLDRQQSRHDRVCPVVFSNFSCIVLSNGIRVEPVTPWFSLLLRSIVCRCSFVNWITCSTRWWQIWKALSLSSINNWIWCKVPRYRSWGVADDEVAVLFTCGS